MSVILTDINMPEECDSCILKKIYYCTLWVIMDEGEIHPECPFKKLPEIEKYTGCEGCAFWDKETWEMPCKECKRNCKDYWRKAKDD